MDIRLLGDPGLLIKTKDVTDIDGPLLMAVNSMYKLLHPGAVGVAANQVGISRSFFVWAVGREKPKVIINPSIIDAFGVMEFQEGCLSLPKRTFMMRRYKTVIIAGINDRGEEMVVKSSSDLHSALYQHEIDHLNGILTINNHNLIDEV